MGIKTYRPRTAGLRHRTGLTYEELSGDKPYKALLVRLPKSGGRNNKGHLSMRNRGGGYRKMYRIDRFPAGQARHPRHRRDNGVRSQPFGLHLPDQVPGRRAALHPGPAGPQGRPVDRLLGQGRRHRARATPPCSATSPSGTVIHNIELQKDKGGQIVRTAGAGAQILAKEGEFAQLRLPSVRDPQGPSGLPGDDRPGRQPRPPERHDRQGRPDPLVGLAAPRPGHGHEPDRPSARRRRRARPRAAAIRSARKASRPRASRPGETSGPGCSSSEEGVSNHGPVT